MGFLFSGQTQASTRTVASGVTIQSSCYGSVVPVVYGRTRIVGNLIWYGDFKAIPGNGSSGGSKGGGGGNGGKGGSGEYTYTASFIFALAEGACAQPGVIWTSKSAEPWSDEPSLGFKSGAVGQSPWGYLSTNHPAQAIGYSGTSYVCAGAYELGDSAQLPNFSYELNGLLQDAIPGLPDANPAAVVADVLTNARYGVGFSAAHLDSLDVFSAYCAATGMVISPLFDTQQDAASLLNQIVQDCNAEFVWSGTTLTIVPYGDQTITANGATYTAPSAPLFSLDDDDFLDTGSGDPVQCTRARPSDQMNSIKLEWLNRSNNYNIEVVESQNLAAIQLYGLRADQPRQSHYFCNLAAATMSATLTMQRQSVRNQFTFTVGWRYAVLDPMDIIEITDAGLGLEQQWVRIVSIEEDDNGNLEMTVEEVLGGTGSAPLYSFQTGNPYIANYNVAPGSVNQPLIFEPPPGLTNGVPQVWIGASGGANWGGCDIWLSTDNATYQNYGRIIGPARQGVLTASLASASDPDTADTLSVNLGESGGELTIISGTSGEAAANAFQTLCYVDNGGSAGYELLAYGVSALTAASQYNLSYLRRGAYGSTIASHPSGANFCRLDSAIAEIDLPANYVGTTIYVKLTSFNIWGGGEEDLSTVDEYSITPSGIGSFVAPPSDVTISVGYVQQNDGTIQPYMQIGWTASPDPLFDTYRVEWSPTGLGEWTGIVIPSSATSYRVIPVPLATPAAFDARVRAVRNQGGPFFSSWAETTNVATTGKTGAPGMPTGLAATPGFQHINLTWAAPSDDDIAYYQIAWNLASSGGIPNVAIADTTSWTLGGLANFTAYAFAVQAVNRSGVGSFYTATIDATTLLTDSSGLAVSSATNANVGLLASNPVNNLGSTSSFVNAISTFDVVLPAGGFVQVVAGFVQVYSSTAPDAWFLKLIVDGTGVLTVGGGAFQPAPCLVWGESMAAGSHSFQIEYAANGDARLTEGLCSAQALFR